MELGARATLPKRWCKNILSIIVIQAIVKAISSSLSKGTFSPRRNLCTFSAEWFSIASEWSGGQVELLGIRESFIHFSPGIGRDMMRFINDDHVEKVAVEQRQPALHLLDV